jgi:hypothetical protein
MPRYALWICFTDLHLAGLNTSGVPLQPSLIVLLAAGRLATNNKTDYGLVNNMPLQSSMATELLVQIRMQVDACCRGSEAGGVLVLPVVLLGVVLVTITCSMTDLEDVDQDDGD